MNLELIREKLLKLPGVTEGFPFDQETLVFKVGGKMFLLIALESSPLRMNIKADPEKIIELQEAYPDFAFPAYHMNKTHWVTIVASESPSQDYFWKLILESRSLVLKSLPKSKQAMLG